MAKLLRRLVALVEWWAVALLVGLVVIVCLGVFYRYILNSSLSWYDEFASYMLVWLTFYGTVVADYQRRHIGFELVVDKLSPARRRIAEVVAEFSVLGFQFVLFYYGWSLASSMADETAISLVWVKMGWVNSVLPISGALLLLISATRMVGTIIGREDLKGGRAAWSGSSSE
jgi:TRAP-type C4-dicarboxylate transport system permease small subunit